NNDGIHGMLEKSVKVTLTAGQYYPLELQYYNAGGDKGLTVSWDGPGFSKQELPNSALYINERNPASQGLLYKYFLLPNTLQALPDFSTLNPVKSGIIETVNLNPRNQEDNYAFQYTGFIKVDATGEYAFYLNSDDGSKFYINKRLLINNDGLHPMIEKKATVNLIGGYYYP